MSRVKRPEARFSLYGARKALLLETMAYCAEPPLIALVGSPTGYELIAVAKGARRRHPQRKGRDFTGSVVCFHWGAHLSLAKHRLYKPDGRRWEFKKRKPRKRPLHAAVRFVDCREGRSGWQEEVARLATERMQRFGLVVHCGSGSSTDIMGDIDTLTPAFWDRTRIVLCEAERKAMQTVHRRLVTQRGWSGVDFSSFDVAILGRSPFATSGPPEE